MKYRIWSFEHNSWWKSNQMGYTEDISEAGIYNLLDAVAICTEANIKDVPDEAMVPVTGD